MMRGYINASQASAAIEWRDAQGKRFIRTGDLGLFDADGFLILMSRAKDLIISGGHNSYPIDLETVLDAHEVVEESAVFGVRSERWGETPVAAVTLLNAEMPVPSLLAWTNERVGKIQRLHEIVVVDALPRNALGKVDKRTLRERHAHQVTCLSANGIRI